MTEWYYGPQSDDDQFVTTDNVENFLADAKNALHCVVCNRPVEFFEPVWGKGNIVLTVICHGHSLQFHTRAGKVFRVLERYRND